MKPTNFIGFRAGSDEAEENLGGLYYPPLSLMSVTIDLELNDFNSNSYQQFRIIDKTATIQLKEIYPFSTAEKNLSQTPQQPLTQVEAQLQKLCLTRSTFSESCTITNCRRINPNNEIH